jgi:hypothetical protein
LSLEDDELALHQVVWFDQQSCVSPSYLAWIIIYCPLWHTS